MLFPTTTMPVVPTVIAIKGPFAQHNAAPVFSGAALLGEKSLHLQSAECTAPRSTPAELLSALRDFFKDNPTWE